MNYSNYEGHRSDRIISNIVELAGQQLHSLETLVVFMVWETYRCDSGWWNIIHADGRYKAVERIVVVFRTLTAVVKECKGVNVRLIVTCLDLLDWIAPEDQPALQDNNAWVHDMAGRKNGPATIWHPIRPLFARMTEAKERNIVTLEHIGEHIALLAHTSRNP
jgi:hypothetical protein